MDPASGPCRRSVVVGLAAAALVLLTACASGGSAPGAHGASPASTALTPRQALRAAEIDADNLKSVVETFSGQGRGASPSSAKGTVRYQLRPNPVASGDMHTDMFGVSAGMKAIFTDDAFYIKIGPTSGFPQVPGKLGKLWLKVSVLGLEATGRGLAQLDQLSQATQIIDVGARYRLSQLATNVRVAGTQTIGGVPTTEYAGSYRTDKVLEALPAADRKKVAAGLQMMGSGSVVYFREWIDGQHHLRKLVEVSTAKGTTFTSTAYFTAFNQPVHVTPPPASQVIAFGL
jgi:hypothetical protein